MQYAVLRFERKVRVMVPLFYLNWNKQAGVGCPAAKLQPYLNNQVFSPQGSLVPSQQVTSSTKHSRRISHSAVLTANLL